jgi:transposase
LSGYAVMRSLLLAFRSILRQPAKRSFTTTPVRTAAAALHRWLDRAETSGIGMIESFVSQLRRDVLAVEGAVIQRWSNGPVEGQVNRLKTLKRQMYGRAGVELLRPG